jgi:putative peptidoglycan lipid II flippase
VTGGGPMTRGGTTGALARAGVIVSGAFLASRALGFVRVSVTTALFGASPQLDAFYAAFRIPDLIFQLVAAGALGSALVPVLSSLLANEQTARGWRVVSIVANLMTMALVLLAIAFMIIAPWAVPLITPGFGPVEQDLTIELTRIMLIGPIFLAMGSVASSLLNANGRFTAAAMAPITYNVVIIAAALLLKPVLGIYALALGVVLGSLAHLLIQVPAILRGTTYRWAPTADVGDATARSVFGLMVPRAVGLGAVQITFIVNTSLASALGTGAITAYQVAFTVLQLPLGVVAQPLGIVLLPTMSRVAALGDHEAFGRLVDRALRLLAYAMMVVTIIAIVLRSEVLTLLFAYGKFDAEALMRTAETLLVFLVGLPAHSLIAVQARAFYAQQDTRTPVAAAVLAVVINVVVSLLTVDRLGLQGLALGIAAGAWVECVVLLVILERRIPVVQVRRELRAWATFAGCALAAGAATWLVMQGFTIALGPDPNKVVLAIEAGIAAAVGGAVYLVIGRILRFAELPQLLSIARRAAGREATA